MRKIKFKNISNAGNSYKIVSIFMVMPSPKIKFKKSRFISLLLMAKYICLVKREIKYPNTGKIILGEKR